MGSFLNDIDQVKAAVDIINEQNADLLLFTGDLVNNVASEIDDFFEILKSTRAKIGKYSILGNHDYGLIRGVRPVQPGLVRELVELQL